MQINILQYLPDNAKIRINDRLRCVFFFDKSISEWSRLFNLNLKNMSRYIHGKRAIPLSLFMEIISQKRISVKSFQNKIEIKVGKGGNYLKIGPFIDITEPLVYVGELIRGDGHIPPNFWNITFVNNNLVLIEYVQKFFETLGIKTTQMSLIKRDDANFLIVRSSLLAYLFSRILEIPAGKKGEMSLPPFLTSDKNLSISAVRGAFDAEGSVTFTGSRRISITSNSKNWLLDLQKILNQLRIESRLFEEVHQREKPIYRIFISHRSNLLRFLKIINPLHDKRKKKLREILDNYTKNPQKEFHKKILLAIKEGISRKRDISNKIKQPLTIIGNNLSWLKRKGFIDSYEKICTNQGCFYKYKVTDKGEKYLEKSLSFFD